MSLRKLATYSRNELDQASPYSEALREGLNKPKSESSLHELRRTAWLEASLATILGTAEAKEVCTTWSQTADTLLQAVCENISHEYFQDAPPTLALFAFGKLGSQELNLSSDVDLMLVGKIEDEANLKFLRQLQSRCGPLDGQDYLFRVDLDLRPGGKLGPIVPTVDQLVDYYGNYGETWERMAFIRLRPLWGDGEIIRTVMGFAKQFIYRRHLDFSLLEDLKSLRAKVHQHYWARSTSTQIDLKLGVGGIRDVELFTHALQVVHGGKDSRLHQQHTDQALMALKESRVLPAEDADFLREHYWQLRALENFVQARQDRQTHLLAQQIELPPALASLRPGLSARLSRCDQIVSTLLGKISSDPIGMPDSEELQQLWLERLGFSFEDRTKVWSEIVETPIFSRQRERDLELRNRFLFKFVIKIAHDQNRVEGSLSYLRDFLKAARAKASFFSMLLSSEPLLETLAALFCSSPYLSRIICARPELLDSIMMRNMESPSPEKMEMDIFLDHLAERRMLAEIFAGGELLRNHQLDDLCSNLSLTADQVTTLLMAKICAEAQIPAEQSIGILALGKWGGRELGLHSDLDCVFVTAEEPTELDQKVVRRFINRLTENHRGGALYSIDTRLKAAGKGGLILTSLSALKLYLTEKAEAWELQAYLRSRWVNKDFPSLVSYCLNKKLQESDLLELERIRLELIKNAKGNLDIKYSEGGLVDVELATQAALLSLKISGFGTDTSSMIQALSQHQPLWNDILQSYKLMRLVEQLLKLVSAESSPKIEKSGSFIKQIEHHLALARLNANSAPFEFESWLRSALSAQGELLKKLDPRRGQR